MSSRGGRPELLVIEGEWTHTGDAESAAQAFEYSSRILDTGSLAKGVRLFGLSRPATKRARMRALVVANRLLEGCVTADRLGVSMMDYFAFAKRLRSKRFSDLPMLRA